MPRADFSRAFLETLLQTERLPKAGLRHYQAELLARFLEHAATNVPFYRERRVAYGATDVCSRAWLQTPTIDRSSLAAHGRELRARRVPRGHGDVRIISSGGSTAIPVSIALTNLESISRVLPTYRMFTGYGMDPGLPLFMIRNKSYAAAWIDDLVYRKWAYPWLPEAKLGDRIHIDIELSPDAQLDTLSARAPAYANTLPSNILRLGLESRRTGKAPSIPVLIAVAEHLPPEVTALAGQAFGSRVINILTSSEAGVIAIQCPASHLLHVQSERVLAEVLDENGRPCVAGETGEVVVTPFYNYAMPLIRYRTGDYVVQGGDCPCGRSLPTIERFVGRKEHLFNFPDGSCRVPSIDRVRISEWIGHDAWQLVQTGHAQAELRYEHSPEIGAAADAIRDHVLDGLGGDWSIDVTEVAKVPKTGGGKRHFCVSAVA